MPRGSSSSPAPQRALKIGDRAADFTPKDPDGNDVSSADLRAKGPLIVSFYRGVWCPYRNMDLRALQAALPEFEHRGTSLLAISPHSAATCRKSQRDNKVTFPILADPGNEVAARFGIRFQLPDDLIELYKDVFENDLALINGDPSWTLPTPGRFVIGQDRTILYVEVNPDYTRRPEPDDLLPSLHEPVTV